MAPSPPYCDTACHKLSTACDCAYATISKETLTQNGKIRFPAGMAFVKSRKAFFYGPRPLHK
jgi:hypothetical protein